MVAIHYWSKKNSVCSINTTQAQLTRKPCFNVRTSCPNNYKFWNFSTVYSPEHMNPLFYLIEGNSRDQNRILLNSIQPGPVFC